MHFFFKFKVEVLSPTPSCVSPGGIGPKPRKGIDACDSCGCQIKSLSETHVDVRLSMSTKKRDEECDMSTSELQAENDVEQRDAQPVRDRWAKIPPRLEVHGVHHVRIHHQSHDEKYDEKNVTNLCFEKPLLY